MEEQKPNSGNEKNTASRAELARERRKASIEEEAKKQAEKEASKANEKKGKKWAKVWITIGVILLALLIFLLSFFGVFDRQATAIKYKDGSHLKVSGAEYEYYYRMYYNYYANMSQQYEQQYSNYFGEGAGKTMTGFDYKKTPDEQKFVSPQGQNETVPAKYGKNPTWADYFEYKAISDSEASKKVYKLAEKDGYKLTKSETKQMNDFIKELEDSAKQNDYSLDAFLRTNYGKGMTKGLLKKIYTRQTIVQRYLDDKKAAFKNSVTTKDISREYKKNQKDYTKLTVRYYQFSDTIADSKAKSMSSAQKRKINNKNKKKAQTFLKAANNGNFSELAAQNAKGTEASSIRTDNSYTTLSDTTYSSLASYINKDAADWAFKKSTKVGDKNIFVKTDDNGLKSYAVVLVASGQTVDNSTYPVSVRQILIKSGTDSNTGEETRSDAAAKQLADKILKKYQDGKHTEKAFAALATKYTEDDGSKSNGGLYEDITSDSQYVDEFKNWALAGHNPGDVGIIKTQYGYHIMYFVKKSSLPQYQLDVRDAVADKKYDAWYKKVINADKAKVSKHWLKKVRSRVKKSAETLIGNLNAQSQQQGMQSYGAY